MLAVHGRKGVLRCGDGDVIALAELHTPFAIEAAIRRRSAVAWDADPEEKRVGEDHGTEGEGVRADGREENGGNVWVHERATGG